MRLRVEVTEQHIADGEAGCADSCAVALACHDAGLPGAIFDGKEANWVGGAIVGLWLVDKHVEVPAPDEAMEFAKRFDRGEHVEPFSFEVEVPDEAVSK